MAPQHRRDFPRLYPHAPDLYLVVEPTEELNQSIVRASAAVARAKETGRSAPVLPPHPRKRVIDEAIGCQLGPVKVATCDADSSK